MVELEWISDKNELVSRLSGEIDHHSLISLREKIDEAIYVFKPALTLLDFRAVSFMDSSGIGLIMGRYRLVRDYGGKVAVIAGNSAVGKILRLSGIDSIVEIRGGENESVK